MPLFIDIQIQVISQQGMNLRGIPLLKRYITFNLGVFLKPLQVSVLYYQGYNLP